MTPATTGNNRGTAPDSAIAFVPALLPSRETRDALVAALQEAGIESRAYYNPPVHRHPVFSHARVHGALPVTEDVAARIISLPMADHLGADAIERVADATRAVLHG